MGARREKTEELTGPSLKLKHMWVLNLLSRYGDRSLSMGEIAKGLGVQERSIKSAVDDLHKLGMVRCRTSAKGRRFSLNSQNPWTRQARTVLNLVYLDPLLDDLSSISHKVILFGDAAYGDGTGNHSIDLFIVTTKRDRTKVLRVLETSELNGRLRPTVVDGEELAGLARRDRLLYDQVSRGLVLWER